MTASAIAADVRRRRLVRRVRLVVLLTIAYNVVEAVVALAAGAAADSSALLAFGLDSVVEVSSAAAVAWQFSGGDHEARERVALRAVAISFLALAVVVAADAGASLLAGRAPAHAPVGIVLAAASLVVMPVLSAVQRRTGRALGSRAVVADAAQTLLCAWMSAALLVGLLLNALLGWWWADPVAGLVIAVLALREGLEAWRGDVCSPAELLFTGGEDD